MLGENTGKIPERENYYCSSLNHMGEIRQIGNSCQLCFSLFAFFSFRGRGKCFFSFSIKEKFKPNLSVLVWLSEKKNSCNTFKKKLAQFLLREKSCVEKNRAAWLDHPSGQKHVDTFFLSKDRESILGQKHCGRNSGGCFFQSCSINGGKKVLAYLHLGSMCTIYSSFRLFISPPFQSRKWDWSFFFSSR